MNPADLPSRGLDNNTKLENKFTSWVKGPEFIYQAQDQWPLDLSEISGKSELSENSEMSEHSEMSENVCDISENSEFDNAVAVDAVYFSQQQSESKLRTVDPELSVQDSWPSKSDYDVVIRTGSGSNSMAQ